MAAGTARKLLVVGFIAQTASYRIYRSHAPLGQTSTSLPLVVNSQSLVLQADTVTDDISATLKQTTDDDVERSPFLEKLEAMEGIWYSDDFYGPHGREWVEVSATLVGAGASSLIATKVSGDANVPSGQTTWRTKGLPDVGGANVAAQVQVRADVNDPNGFSWIPASLALVAEDQIALSAKLSAFQRSTGTFYKHTVGEGE